METGDQTEGMPRHLSCERGMTEKSEGYTGGRPPHHLGGDIGAAQGQRQGLREALHIRMTLAEECLNWDRGLHRNPGLQDHMDEET